MSSVVSVLFQKKKAELSGGTYSRGAEVRPPQRSTYNTKAPDDSCAIGMGIVQALLAVLSGHVAYVSWRERGRLGMAHVLSTSGGGDYDFTWDEREPRLGLYGGFANGPTYQIAVLHLILCYLDAYHGGSERSDEVMGAWFRLVEAMRRCQSSGFDPPQGWSKAAVASACRKTEVRACIEAAADAMWFAMRYRLPDVKTTRAMDLLPEQVVLLPLAAVDRTIWGVDLLTPPSAPRPPTVNVRRRRRRSLPLQLDLSQLQGLTEERGERLATDPPIWSFPDLFDEDGEGP